MDSSIPYLGNIYEEDIDEQTRKFLPEQINLVAKWNPGTDTWALDARDTESEHGGAVDQVDRNRFWELQTALSQMSAAPPSYTEACEQFGFDPRQPVVPGQLGWNQPNTGTPFHILRPWQVQFLTWVDYNGNGKIRANGQPKENHAANTNISSTT